MSSVTVESTVILDCPVQAKHGTEHRLHVHV